MTLSHYTLIFILIFNFFPARYASAQTPFCGYDASIQRINILDPGSPAKKAELDNRIYENLLNKKQHKTAGTFVVPIVFHIMHNNGPENIADSVVVKAVEELNLRFHNATPYFDSTGNQVNIQFCLASVDPQGNPTSGITRTVTNLTNITYGPYDDTLKSLSRWSPLLYCNVWVVREILGTIAGYASYPVWAGNGNDGIVVEAAFLNNSHVLAHEAGHYFGLAHTFSFSCNNQNCLLEGDQVCDTPPDTSQFAFPCLWNSCSSDTQDTTGLSPFLTDVNELPNYMDYTSCPLSFTQGQADRMEMMLQMARSLLLISNGCGGNPGQAVPVAGFTFSASTCNNGEVVFNDSIAVNSITTEWDFNNDGLYELTGHSLTYTFPLSGNYLVTQRVTGLGGQTTTSQMVAVIKGSTFNYPIVVPSFPMDTLLVCAGDTLLFEGDPGGTSYLWSTGETTPSITVVADTSMAITLTMTDATGFVWSTACAPVYLVVYPNPTPVITYNDSLGYTCQGDILSLTIPNPASGLYTWFVYHVSTGWFNTGNHSYNYDYYPDPVNGNSFVVTYTNPAGCNSVSDTLLIQAQPLPFLQGVPLYVNGLTLNYPSPPAQFQWYNGTTPIPGANSNFFTVTGTGCYQLRAWNSAYPECDTYTDTVCFEFTGIKELSVSINISPNPVKSTLTVSSLNILQGESMYKIMDVNGRIVMKGTFIGKDALTIDCSMLLSGCYLLEIANRNEIFRRKIVVLEE